MHASRAVIGMLRSAPERLTHGRAARSLQIRQFPDVHGAALRQGEVVSDDAVSWLEPKEGLMRQRWWFLSGVGFAVLLVAGVMLAMGTYPEDSSAPDADWTKVLSSSGERAKIIVGAYLLCAAGLLFLWFASAIRTAFESETTTPSVLASVATTSGIVFVSVLLLGGLTLAAVPGSISFGGAPVPAADFARQFSQLGTGFLLAPGALVAALFVASTSRLGAVTRVFSRAVTMTGYVAAVLLLFGALLLPFLALPIWVIVTSISLARRPVASTAPDPQTAAPIEVPVHAHA
jgi:hypothetical protein